MSGAFGGANLIDLYVTTLDGRLYRVPNSERWRHLEPPPIWPYIGTTKVFPVWPMPCRWIEHASDRLGFGALSGSRGERERSY